MKFDFMNIRTVVGKNIDLMLSHDAKLASEGFSMRTKTKSEDKILVALVERIKSDVLDQAKELIYDKVIRLDLGYIEAHYSSQEELVDDIEKEIYEKVEKIFIGKINKNGFISKLVARDQAVEMIK